MRQGLLSSPHVVAAFDLRRFHHLVDLGGATGHLAIAACQHYPRLRAVVFDLPEAGALAREVVGSSPAADQIDVMGGDFFVDALPDGDLYSVGRILHDWTEAKVLFLLKRNLDRLPAGGGLLIAEKLLNEEKNGPRAGPDAEPGYAALHGRKRSAPSPSTRHSSIKSGLPTSEDA